MANGRPVVRFERVSKWFGRIQALNNVSFTVMERSVHALLGHNGAGKTTSLRLIAGLLQPSSGRVRVFGLDPYHDPRVRLQVGYAGENEGLYRNLTVHQNLQRFCMLRLGDRAACSEEVSHLADVFELHEIMSRRVSQLSAGNRQRVVLARAFLGKPRLLVLDEPMNKLDPVWRTRVKSLLRDYVEKEGATAIYSTHILSDAEELSDHVTILRRGRVVYHGPLPRLLAKSKTVIARIASRDPKTIELLREKYRHSITRMGEGQLQLALDSPEDAYELLAYIASSRLAIELLEVRKASLEDIYTQLYSTGKEADET